MVNPVVAFGFLNFGTHEINEMVSSRVDGLAEKTRFVDVALLPLLDQVGVRELEYLRNPDGNLTTVFAAANGLTTADVAIGDHHPVIYSASAKTQEILSMCVNGRADCLDRPWTNMVTYVCDVHWTVNYNV